MNFSPLLLGFASVAIILACGSEPTSPFVETDEPIQTDQSTYTPDVVGSTDWYTAYEFEVIARFTNRSDRTLWLLRCLPEDSSPPVHQIHLLAERESAYEKVWGCVGHDYHIQMTPGTSRIDTLSFHGPTTLDSEEQEVIGQLGGRMRIRYQAVTCPPSESDCFQDLAHESLRSSNSFEVQLPD